MSEEENVVPTREGWYLKGDRLELLSKVAKVTITREALDLANDSEVGRLLLQEIKRVVEENNNIMQITLEIRDN